ncbi:thioesterase-like superfamily-domain-containing protein [Microdochium bolleyi]|uniref:Thioesterase-like superfamily-domain-containing protein n=1 Tax=Microdochium bolleyi TaxID=196109 RepID=A0A136IW59_9PEZI|nr:thioesterase-like superfamily-domain-containing protein [Microdochium bolleyi]
MVNTKQAKTIIEQVAVEEIAPGHFRTKWLPGRMGNPLPIAYGGCALGAATRAAFETVPDTHHIYSLMGHYHGPASTLQPLVVIVHKTRDTKTFATRRVVLTQLQADGKTTRTVMEMLIDFHVDEPAALEYSPSTVTKYAGVDEQLTEDDAGGDPKTTAAAKDMFAMNQQFFESRHCREGVAGQNLHGMLKHTRTTQDERAISDKTSAEYTRSKHDLSGSRGDRAAAVSFLLDGALSFLPLTHNHMWFDDAGACSSLDFALRFMVPDIDLSKEWHLRERTAISAAHGRTYAEGRLWDAKGQLVASMTQASILRPKPAPKDKSAAKL